MHLKTQSDFEVVQATNNPVYLGNGGMGVNLCSDERDHATTTRDGNNLFAMDGCSSHYWVTIVDTHDRVMTTTAQSGNGTILDHVSIKY